MIATERIWENDLPTIVTIDSNHGLIPLLHTRHFGGHWGPPYVAPEQVESSVNRNWRSQPCGRSLGFAESGLKHDVGVLGSASGWSVRLPCLEGIWSRDWTGPGCLECARELCRLWECQNVTETGNGCAIRHPKRLKDLGTVFKPEHLCIGPALDGGVDDLDWHQDTCFDSSHLGISWNPSSNLSKYLKHLELKSGCYSSLHCN